MAIYLRDMQSSGSGFAASLYKEREQRAQKKEDRKRSVEAAELNIQKGFDEGRLNSDGSLRQEPKRGILGGVGEFFSGVGNMVGEAGGGAVDAVSGMASQTWNLGRNAIAQSDVESSRNELIAKGKEINDLAQAGKITWEEAKSRRDELDRTLGAETDEKRMVSEAILQQSEAAGERFDEGSFRAYQVAQYIPGISAGVDGAGTIMAAAQGRDGFINERLLKLTQGVDWNELSDEEKEQAIKSRNVGAALSPLDFLGGSGKFIYGTVRGAVASGSARGGLAAGRTAYGRSVAGANIKDAVSGGIRANAKRAAIGATVGTGVGAGLGVALDLAMNDGDNIGEAAFSGAQGGLIAGVLGTPLSGVRGANTQARQAGATTDIETEISTLQSEKQRRIDAVDEQLRDVEARGDQDGYIYKYTTEDGRDVSSEINDIDIEIRDTERALNQLKNQAEGVDNTTGQAAPPEGVDPSTYTGDAQSMVRASDGVDRYETKLNELQTRRDDVIADVESRPGGGVRKEVDAVATRENFDRARSLTDAKQRLEHASELVEDTIRARGMTKQDIDNTLADLDRGVVPTHLVREANPVNSANEAIAKSIEMDPSDTQGILRLGDELADADGALAKAKSEVMPQDDFDDATRRLNLDYGARKEGIQNQPDPLRAREQAELDEWYQGEMANLESEFEASAPRRREIEETEGIKSQIEQNIMDRWNDLQETNPGAFGPVDAARIERYRENLNTLRAQEVIDSPNSRSIQENKAAVEEATQDLSGTEITSAREADPQLNNAVGESQVSSVPSGRMKDPHLLDYGFRAPRETIKNKMGSPGKKIAKSMDDAQRKMNRDAGELKLRARDNDWELAFGTRLRDTRRGYSRQAWNFLDKGKSIKKLKGETDAHFERRTNALNDIKKFHKEMADKFGLTAEQRRQNYMHHISTRAIGGESDDIARTLTMLDNGVDVDGSTLTNSRRAELRSSIEGVDADTAEHIRNARLYTVDDGFLKKRSDANNHYLTDPSFATMTYARKVSERQHLEPVLNEMKELEKVLTRSQQDFVRNAISQMKKQDTGLDKMTGSMKVQIFGKTVTANDVAKGGVNLSNTSLMGLSATTGALQHTAIVNNVAEGHIVDFMRTLPDLMGSYGGARFSRSYRETLESGALENGFAQVLSRGGLTGKLGKIQKALMAHIQAADTSYRVQAFQMGKREYARSIGKKMRNLTDDEMSAAVDHGRQMVERAQFKFDTLDVPLGQNTTLGRAAVQLQQFNISQTKYNARILTGKGYGHKNWIKNEDGTFSLNKEGANRLVKMAAGHALFYAAAKEGASFLFGEGAEGFDDIFGWGVFDLQPFGEQVEGIMGVISGESEVGDIDMPRSPLFSSIMGNPAWNQPGLLQFGQAQLDLASGAIDQDEYDDIMSDMPKHLLRNFTLAGTQLNRMSEGANLLESGTQEGGSGMPNFYMQNRSGINAIKALLLGPYATDEGKKWLEDGMNTIPSNSTIDIGDESVKVIDYMETLDDETKAQYVDFYQTREKLNSGLRDMGRSTTNVRSNIRNRLEAGRINLAQANLEIDKHNQIIYGMYSPFYNQWQGKMDPLLSTVLVDDILMKNIN